MGETSTRCLTAGKENAHVEFELCGYRVAASHYAVRHYESWNTEALRSWVFEGSADGREWVVLRAHADDETIKKKGAVSAFAVERTGEAYSRFRIRMVFWTF